MPEEQPKCKICNGTSHYTSEKAYEADCMVCRPPDCSDQPNTNAMIFEQVNGSIKVALELLEQLETKGIDEENQKQGCIWTLKGWHDNNLKHLQKEYE